MAEACDPPQGAPLEFRLLRPDLAEALSDFFQTIAEGGDERLFHPHPMTREHAEKLCAHAGHDLYYAACVGLQVVAYGLLRGWDEGYETPSLGIAVHPFFRGKGLARPFMGFLHAAAKLRGATKVRLTVHAENHRAVALYRSLGYRFEAKNDREYVGFLGL